MSTRHSFLAPLHPLLWLNRLQYALVPPTCILCGADGAHRRDLCDPCGLDLPWLTTACPRCAAPMERSQLCGRCQTRPPAFDYAVAVFRYTEPVSGLVTGLKFRGKLHHAPLLGGLAADHLPMLDIERPALIVPVPMHSSALRKRGYNQALEIARPVSRRLGIPIDYRHVRKVRANAPQSQLTVKERARNVKGVYAVRGRVPAEHVVVFDDVMTTGSTVGAVALELRRAGVKRVGVWCLARTERDEVG